MKSVNIVPVATNNLGLVFFERAARASDVLPGLPVQPHLNVDTIIGTSPEQWVHIRISFTAANDARYFLIGNFFPDEQTKASGVSADSTHKNIRVAYYLLDDLYIGPPVESMRQELRETGRYTFRTVYFSPGSTWLQAKAHKELDKLAAYLRRQPGKSAEIIGHTDNRGSAQRNLALSEARAKAVADYLLRQGVEARRLTYRGLGEQRPVSSNSNAQGRRQNRRVECVLK